MQFSWLKEIPDEWNRLLVIGRTIERDGSKYHIIGMSLGKEGHLYILEPFHEPAGLHRRKNSRRTQGSLMKEHEERSFSYLHCSEISLGTKRLKIQGGQGGPLKYSEQDYRTIYLFLSMMKAGWKVPDWLKEEDWNNLQLITLDIADLKRLPKYSPEMPITLKHKNLPLQHMVEKTVTLTVGKKRSLHFTDHTGEEVWCHINNVTLIDVWEDTEKQFNDPKYTNKVTPEQLQEIKEHCYQALEQNCPKGMCYIGIEYECSKDYSLQFFTKEYLKSRPGSSNGSASFLLMRLKPDKKTGTHGLPLRGEVMHTAVSPDTVKVPAELVFYFEKTKDWEERI